jgi:hypothetical protein
MMPPALFSDHAVLAWFVLESLDLWAAHGPQALLVGPICHVGIFSTALEGIHSIGYRIVRRVLTESENRGCAQASSARFLFSFGSVQWFEPYREGVLQAQIAREELLERGELQCVRDLQRLDPVVASMLVHGRRILGGDPGRNRFLRAYRQLTIRNVAAAASPIGAIAARRN